MIGDIVTVTVDRPLGSRHPKHKDMYYPVNYGYIEGIIAPDGEEQDAYILGVNVPVEKFTGRVIAVIHRDDDVEEKWVVCPDELSFSREEIAEMVDFQERYFRSEVIMRQDEGLRRIIVIGSSGSGKSTFARRLRDMTGLPLYYLDMIRHKPDRTTISSEEFDKRLGDILSEDRWIIDGNYQRTLEARLKKCDTVFLFDIPVEVCLAGAKARVGTKREDMPWTETELDEEFRQWIVDFPKKQLPEIYGLLEKYKDKNIVVFKSREEAEAYLKGELL